MGGRYSVMHLFLKAGVGVAALLLTGSITGSVVTPVGAATPRVAATGHVTADVAGTYVPLSPSRITDTRAGSGYPNAGQPLAAGESINVQVTGAGGVPTSGVTAVVVNVTVIGPTAAGFVTVYPEGTTQPVVSNLNFTAGETLANLATVPLGSQGGVTVYNFVGSVNVVVDVEGYYTTAAQTSGLYNPVNPLRVFGTLASGAVVGPGVVAAVTVAGVDGVPADASAVVANVTVAGSTGPGFITAFPTPTTGAPSIAIPNASNVNFTTGQVIANRVLIPVGANGQIDVYNFSGSVKVDVDLDGYYTGSSGELGSAYTPMSPVRVVDTRVGLNGTTIGANTSETFSFLSEGLSTTATALVANLTVVAGAAAGYVTVYPTNESSPPGVSDANFTSGAVVQNFALAPLNEATTKVYNSSALPADVVIDAFGFFALPPREVTVSASQTSLPADGMSTSLLTVTVNTGSGVAFDDMITLNSTASVAGSCGGTSLAGSTNASGQATSTYTASTTAGTCTITATEANGATMGSVVITQT